MNYCCSFDHILTYDEFKEWSKYIHDFNTNYITFWYPKEGINAEIGTKLMKMTYQAYAEREGLKFRFDDTTMLVYRPDRQTIELYYQGKFNPSQAKNRMGCNEDWYDCYYAITQTLQPDVVDNMSDEALEAMIEVICAVQNALY